MKDPRISIRLTQDELNKLKIFAIYKQSTIQKIMHNIIVNLLKESNDEEKN